jgi:thiol-disulfide isomerase/thioredoxin
MVEFVSAGCPICQRMQPVVAAAERGCALHGIRVRQLDVATSAGRAAAAERGVLGVPTFLFLDSTGKEVARLVGQQPQEVLIQSLEVLAGQKCDGFRPITGTAPKDPERVAPTPPTPINRHQEQVIPAFAGRKTWRTVSWSIQVAVTTLEMADGWTQVAFSDG